MTISALPVPPTRNDAVNFRARADALLAALPTFVTEANALSADMNAVAADAISMSSGYANAAADSADRSSESAALSSSCALAAQSYATAPAWVSGASYDYGAVAWSPATNLIYRRIISGGGAVDPSADSTNWALASSGAPQLVDAPTEIVIAHANGHYAISYAGKVTVSLPPSPAVGALVWVTVANGRSDTVISCGAHPIMGITEDLVIDDPSATVALRYINTTQGWRVI